jgi:hypothetical protein
MGRLISSIERAEQERLARESQEQRAEQDRLTREAREAARRAEQERIDRDEADPSNRAERERARRRRRIYSATALLVVALAAGAYYFSLAPDTPSSPPQTRYVAPRPAPNPVAKTDPAPVVRKWVLRRTLPLSSAAVAISPDGKQLAGATGTRWLARKALENQIRVLDLATGDEIHAFAARGSFVESLDFSADGKRLASAGDAVTIWDSASGAKSSHSTASGTPGAWPSARTASCWQLPTRTMPSWWT